MVNVDPVLEAIGGKGRYQLQQYFLAIIAALPASFQLLNIVFVGRDIPHVCKRPGNLSDLFDATDIDFIDVNNSFISFEKCNIHVEANISGYLHTRDLSCLYGYDYDDPKETSVMSDMDVVCDKATLQSLGQTLLILGQGIGSVTLTIFSDRYGRRTVLLMSQVGLLAAGVGIAFVPNYVAFLILRVFLGIFQMGIVLGFTTILIEVFSAQHRRFGGFVWSLIWSFSACFIPLIAYLMQSYSWRYNQLAYCSASLFVIVQFIFLDESVSWLITNRKTEQVIKNLKKAARISGKDEKTVLEVYKKNQESEDIVSKPAQNGKSSDTKTSESQDEAIKPSFLAVMKKKRLALTSFVLWFMWFTESLIYFGLYMTSHTLAGDRFINVFVLALVEAPSVLVFYFMIDRYGRKATSITLHAIAAIGLLLATLIGSVGKGSAWANITVTVCSCIGMFGVVGAWYVSSFATAEIYPTNLRNFGLGTGSFFARIGGMLAPFSSQLADYASWGPGVIFGGCCLLVTFLVTVLPETMGRELPQTIEDMMAQYKKKPEGKEEDADIQMF